MGVGRLLSADLRWAQMRECPWPAATTGYEKGALARLFHTPLWPQAMGIHASGPISDPLITNAQHPSVSRIPAATVLSSLRVDYREEDPPRRPRYMVTCTI